jgi:hypothetical protein
LLIIGKEDKQAINPLEQKVLLNFQEQAYWNIYFDSVSSYDSIGNFGKTNCIDNPKENLVGFTIASSTF